MSEHGRDEDRLQRRASGSGRNESEKDDEIGLCRRRRDSTERAGVPQTGRRLSGMQPPPHPPRQQSVGLGPTALLPPPARPHPSTADRSSPNPLRVFQWYTATWSSTTTITTTTTTTTTTITTATTTATTTITTTPPTPSPLLSPITARKHKCRRTDGTGHVDVRLGIRVRTCVHVCARGRLDDSTSRPLTAISAAGHQRVPTGPNRPGRPASVTFARARGSYLPIFLFFLIFLPSLLFALVRFSFCERVRFLFLSSLFLFPPPLPPPLPRTLFFLFFVRILLSSVPLYLLASLREDYLAPAKDISIASVVDTESIIK